MASAQLVQRRKRILITGSNGNLGEKLARNLLELQEYDLILIDLDSESKVPPCGPVPRVEYYQADLSKVSASWTGKLRRSDVVFHFAGCKLNADVSWASAAQSLDTACNVLLHAAQANVKRVVLASSWHVSGSCKDLDCSPSHARDERLFSPTDPVSPGTQWFAGCRLIDSTSYAVPKLAEERLAKCLAESNPTTVFLVLRMGWCQPGENIPGTLSAVGCEADEPETGLSLSAHGSGNPLDDSQFLREWFRNTWLSNRDFCTLCSKCISGQLPTTSKGFYIVNAVSANAGSHWDLEAGKDLLGYEPQDDAHKCVEDDGWTLLDS
ncbi:uncharacterized protein LOC135814764 [Sycon ciliatum]|uniref:uncharacterized protein LOC135814764 n=1 Tax=Sycon ciliatum TaxID=27933 RepID=UPI0031F5FF7D